MFLAACASTLRLNGARVRTAASIPVHDAIEIDADISNQTTLGGNEASPAKRLQGGSRCCRKILADSKR